MIYDFFDASFSVWAGNKYFPVFVFQTPMSSATSSWQRWRFVGMPKGKRKKLHKRSLSDDFSLVTNFSPLCAAETLDTTSQRSTGVKQCHVCFCLAQHPVASYVIELHCYVLEAYLKIIWPNVEFPSPNCQTYLVQIQPVWVCFNLYNLMHCQSKHCTYRPILVIEQQSA